MGDHARAEARGRALGNAAAENQGHVITAAHVPILPDELLKEFAPLHGALEDRRK